MQVTEVRNRLHACGLAESTKAIPHAADGVDEWVHLWAVDLAANTPHIDLDDVGCGIEMKVPNVLPPPILQLPSHCGLWWSLLAMGIRTREG